MFLCKVISRRWRVIQIRANPEQKSKGQNVNNCYVLHQMIIIDPDIKSISKGKDMVFITNPSYFV